MKENLKAKTILYLCILSTLLHNRCVVHVEKEGRKKEKAGARKRNESKESWTLALDGYVNLDQVFIFCSSVSLSGARNGDLLDHKGPSRF